MPIFPKKLKKGDTLAVIAPALSLDIVSSYNRDLAIKRLEQLGFKVVFGSHVSECDALNSSSIESRIADLHWAFLDPEIDGILTVIGGYNSNQLLDYIDWDLIRDHPKVFVGYSDITVLQNAILARSGMVTYSGPSFASFAELHGFAYTLASFKQCVMESIEYQIVPSESWSNDSWYIDQENRDFIHNPGYLVINEGQAEGTLIGGNLCTLNLLQGTKYMPDLHDSILFLEDDHVNKIMDIDRNLQSLLHLEAFHHVKGLVLGRFEKMSEINNEQIIQMIKSKKELAHIPVIANVDFGHTNPMISFPVGGSLSLQAHDTGFLTVLKH